MLLYKTNSHEAEDNKRITANQQLGPYTILLSHYNIGINHPIMDKYIHRNTDYSIGRPAGSAGSDCVCYFCFHFFTMQYTSQTDSSDMACCQYSCILYMAL